MFPLHYTPVNWSAWQDFDLRSLRPERSALSRLRYTPMVPTARIERASIALQATAMTSSAKSAKLGGHGENRTLNFRVQAGCVPISTTRPLLKTWGEYAESNCGD